MTLGLCTGGKPVCALQGPSKNVGVEFQIRSKCSKKWGLGRLLQTPEELDRDHLRLMRPESCTLSQNRRLFRSIRDAFPQKYESPQCESEECGLKLTGEVPKTLFFPKLWPILAKRILIFD